MHPLPLALASFHLVSPNLASPPLESFLLTYALNALWQVPLLFAAAWLAARTARRAGPTFQHALWTTTLFAEILLPALSATPTQLLQSAESWLASLRHTAPALNPTVTITIGEAHAATGFHLPPALLTTAAIFYLTALLFFTTRLAIGLYRTAALRRRAHPLALTGHARDSYHRYANLFAVPHARVATSSEIASPITLGIRRPTLLLPTQFDTLLDEDLDAALAHEFAHIRRRDFAKNLAYEILSLPIAFHPALWLTRRHMSETRELVCDALAASAVAGPQRYARSLLRLATQFATQPNAASTPHAIGIFDAHPFTNFERRVMHLTRRTIELRGAARLVPTALTVALIGAACTSALAFRQQVIAPQSTTPPASKQTAAVQPVVLAVPRSGDPAKSYQIEIPDGSGQPSALPPGSYTLQVLPPPSAPPNQDQATSPVRISPGVIAGQRENFKAPIYPEDAKKAHLNGTVVLRAIIDKDGTIKTLSIVSSTNPMFNDSALEAVHKWTYKPYLLNGEPTAVDTNITVNYALSPSPAPEPSPAPSPTPSPSPNPSDSTVRPYPIVIKTADPIFPPAAKAQGNFSGNVLVSLVVGADGVPKNVAVVRGIKPAFDRSALAAVEQYRFKPALRDGEPIDKSLYMEVHFQVSN